MTSKTRQKLLVTGIIALVVLLDQSLKLYIHNHLQLYQSIEILPWFELCYVENNGMAFGMEWFSKLALTLFRIVAVGALAWYINKLIKQGWRTSYLVMLALVTAGALGNIIDCMFYGIAFGYAPFMYGRVIDMLYFPLIHNSAGDVLFFRPVFNLADTAITVAIFAILIFFRNDFNKSFENPKPAEAEAEAEAEADAKTEETEAEMHNME